MKQVGTSRVYETFRLGAVAGAAGGVAEILWIAFFGVLTGSDTTEVARSISAVVGAALPIPPLVIAPAAFGIVIPMLAALALGIVLAFAWQVLWARWPAPADGYAFTLGALAIVWCFNFFVVLPLISPHFVDLHRTIVDTVPYPVSLVSKLLFGLAAAAVFKCGTSSQPILIRM